MREIRQYSETTIREELREISKKYHPEDYVLKRIRSFYNTNPTKLGNATKILNFLRELLRDYGYTDEEFSQFLSSTIDLVQCKPSELVKKVVILDYCDMLEVILFERPYKLLDNTNISSKSLYAIIKDLQNSGLEINVNTLFNSSRTSVNLKSLREQYPLTDTRYCMCETLYKVKHKKLREQNNPVLKLEKNSEN